MCNVQDFIVYILQTVTLTVGSSLSVDLNPPVVMNQFLVGYNASQANVG